MPQISYMRGAENNLKIRFISFILIFSIYLSSCAAGRNKAELSDTLSSIESAEYTAHITAAFPSKEASFTINYVLSGEDGRATVLLPEEVAGISYTVSGENGALEFDGAILEIGRLDNEISPFSCLHTLTEAWKRADFSEITRTMIHGQNALLAVSSENDGMREVEYRTWFSEEEFLPLYAEIFSGGKRIIMCEFERAEHNKNEDTQQNRGES